MRYAPAGIFCFGAQRFFIVAPRKLPQAGQQPFFGAFANENLSGGVGYDIDDAVFFFFGGLRSCRNELKVRLSAGQAMAPPRADQALRVFGRADDGAQVHYGRGIVGRVSFGGQGGSFFLNEVHNFVGRAGEMKKTADNANDVAVDDGFGQVKAESQQTCGSVGADAFQPENLFSGLRENAVKFTGNCACGGVQRAGARIIAQSLPVLVDFVQIGSSQFENRRKTLHETFEIRNDRFDGCLLQHQFGYENNVRIGVRSALNPPREISSVSGIPVEKQR